MVIAERVLFGKEKLKYLEYETIYEVCAKKNITFVLDISMAFSQLSKNYQYS